MMPRVTPLRGWRGATKAAALGAFMLMAGTVGLTAGGEASAKQVNDRRDVRQIAIPISDFDFADPAQVDALHRRILRAANRVCGGDLRLSLGQAARRTRCVETAADQAVIAAGIAPLSVLHANLTERVRYRSWRARPDDGVMRMVAEAGGGDANAGTIYQPE